MSKLLAAADFKSLKDLVDDDTIDKMRHIVGNMSSDQRQLLAINGEEIFWIFPYEIQFITQQSADDGRTRFFVEIMVVASIHALEDIEQFENRKNSQIFGDAKKLLSKCRIANYRFVKEFTKGVEDEWTINYICHAKLSDNIKELENLD